MTFFFGKTYTNDNLFSFSKLTDSKRFFSHSIVLPKCFNGASKCFNYIVCLNALTISSNTLTDCSCDLTILVRLTFDFYLKEDCEKDVTKTGNGERGAGNGERKSGNELSAETSIKIQYGR